MRIMDVHISLPPLKFQDFDTRPIDCKTPQFRNCSLINECVGKVMLADMFMSKLNLLLISGRIIQQLYNLQGFAASTSEWAMHYTPKRKSDLDADCLGRLQAELDDWSHTLNNYCHMDYHCDDVEDEVQTKVLRIHAGALQLLHLTAQEALHRPLTFPAVLQQFISAPGGTEDSSIIRARMSVSAVASQISDTMRNLRERNLLEYMPPLTVSCLVTAIASFLVEMKLARKLPADLPDHRYHDCIRSLRKLRDVWPVTRGTCAMVNQMATNNQIWYARTLKMLAEPTPIVPNENTQGIGSSQQRSHSESQTQLAESRSTLVDVSSAPRPLEASPTSSFDHHVDGKSFGDTEINVPDDMASTYLASMYPFLWTAADFDVFGPSSCHELFMDNAVDTSGLDEVLIGEIS